MRASSAEAPVLKDVKFYGSPEEIEATGGNQARIKCSPDEVAVWPPAVRQFRFHHGGTDDQAKVQIRSMLADFLVKSGRVVSETNYLVLSRDGYRLHIAPSRDRVTGYTTVHRERTWEQFKRGIPSRIGRIEAQPMPILPSLDLCETETVRSRPNESLRLSAIKSAQPNSMSRQPAPSEPDAYAALARSAESTTGAHIVKVSSPATTPDNAAGPPPDRLPPSAQIDQQLMDAPAHSPSPARHTLDDDFGQSDANPVEPRPGMNEPTPHVQPAATSDGMDRIRPSTLATVAVSVLSTVVVMRAASWIRRGSKA